MSLRTLKHYGRLARERKNSEELAEQLRPDQLAYWQHLLQSWGVRDAKHPGRRFVWLPWNPERAALRKTLEQRP